MKDLRIGTRIWLGFSLIIILLLMTVALSISRMHQAQDRIADILDDRYKKIKLASEIKYNVAVIHQHIRGAVIAGDALGVEREVGLITSIRLQNAKLLDALEKIITASKARDIYLALTTARADDLAKQQDLLSLLQEGRQAEAREFLAEKVFKAEQIYVGRLAEIIDLQAKKMSEEAALNEIEFDNAQKLMTITAAAAVIIALIAGAIITRSVTTPLNQAVKVARRVAAGDLTADIQENSASEIGALMAALRNMNSSLGKIVGEVRSGTEVLLTASNQIASGNQDLSSRTEQQAAALEETASSMEELTSTVKQNADNARQANEFAASASDIAIKGGSMVTQVVNTMGAINDSSKKIGDIISVIDGIAFQTNILALNAAVEAARAGEQGRGFAVVAAEVRNLAQRSTAAAREIKVLIHESLEKVEAGAILVDQAGSTMSEVVVSVTRVASIISEITSASQEQTSGIEQINHAIMQMDDATQQNAALVEEAAAAAENMKQQATKLSQMVNIFQLLEPLVITIDRNTTSLKISP